MNTIRFTGRVRGGILGFALLVILLCGVITLGPALAQKSKKPQPVASSQTTTKELLQKYRGKMTSIGTITKVEGDYFVVEEEGITSMYPIGALQALRLVKVETEEGDSTRIEIRLVAHD